MWILVNLLVMVGMLFVVPGGMDLLGTRVTKFWYAGAAAGSVSLWLPRGGWAAGLAVIYALSVGVLFAYRRRLPLILLGIAAVALIAERAGHELFGFETGVLALTVAHFHFAGFAAALIAGLHRRISPGRLADAAALTVPAGTLLVLIGYFTGEFVELAGAVVLTAGMWAVGWLTWRHARGGRYDRLTAVLLGISAVVLAASMVLALSWALGEATGLPHPSLGWMAATHGVANALGFAVCGIVGWRRTPFRSGAIPLRAVVPSFREGPAHPTPGPR
ncbi:YndJ family protein [Actinoplanes sp. NPDC051861]|uniref:YndJ family protein n=1 Tax=Actinoplanes sp. NPDC051861 TaxID=3155170 RepID=UPI003414FD3D